MEVKKELPHLSMAEICGWFGITKAAYYQSLRRGEKNAVCAAIILQEIRVIRKNHPKMGGKKMFSKLIQFLNDNGIKMGRDAFFKLLQKYGFLVRKRRNRARTTYSHHWMNKYPNLIIDFIPTAPNQLWVSDITYWRIGRKFLYISFITDAYSRKIVGYHLADNLGAIETEKALKMALKSLEEKPNGLIHHSDRGVQYCSSRYVALLNKYKVEISMTESGDPRENAIAERVNGIMKEEYLLPAEVKNNQEAKKVLDRSVALYNTDRPHLSISNKVPEQIHSSKQDLEPKRLWKNKQYSHTQTAN